jgi:O-methyltransferase involved in polyketide biosynthesis
VSLLRRSSAAVSPTAYYTGHVWVRHGLAPEELRTAPGVAMFGALQPAMWASRTFGGPTLEGLLLARHRLIDHLLATAIDDGRVSHVVEVAAGMSPRGLRFAERYGDRVTYVETDLPGMAARKRAQLGGMGRLGEHHRVEVADALGTGPGSLEAVLGSLDVARGVAVVSEGLLNYLPPEALRTHWEHVAGGLAGFPHGLYLSDLHLGSENQGFASRAGKALIGAFVRGRAHLHHGNAAEAEQALRDAGFAEARLHRPVDFPDVIGEARPGAELVRVVEARTTA